MYIYVMPRKPINDDVKRHGKALGRLLGSARHTNGRSAQQVAQAANLSIDTLRSVESGRVPTPSFLTVSRIAGALDLSLDELDAAATAAAAKDGSAIGGRT